MDDYSENEYGEPECRLRGAPDGWPYCSQACEEAHETE